MTDGSAGIAWSWTGNFASAGAMKVRRSTDGQITLNISIYKNSNFASGDVPLDLPTGYKPTEEQQVVCGMYNTNTGQWVGYCVIDIGTGGGVTVFNLTSATANRITGQAVYY
jgi:hypothetical protein